MRPVNLIPPEDRRGDKAPLRSGPLSYIVVAGLAVVLLGVYLMVTTSNGIAEKESQLAQLEADLEFATSEAERLAPFAEFATLRLQREATIASLAQSRFDWERVLRELSLIIPADVTLTSLNGSAFANAEGSAAREPISAPNLAVSGCAASHEAVARFVAALEDIDGVTRVGLSRTEAPGIDPGAGQNDSAICGSANIFDLSVAFDSAIVSPEAAEASAAEATPVSAETAPEAPDQTAQDSAARQTEKAKEATNIVPGVVAP